MDVLRTSTGRPADVHRTSAGHPADYKARRMAKQALHVTLHVTLHGVTGVLRFLAIDMNPSIEYNAIALPVKPLRLQDLSPPLGTGLQPCVPCGGFCLCGTIGQMKQG